MFGELDLLIKQCQVAFGSLDVSWELNLIPDPPGRLRLKVVSPSWSKDVPSSARTIYSQDIPWESIHRASQGVYIDRLWNDLVDNFKEKLNGGS